MLINLDSAKSLKLVAVASKISRPLTRRDVAVIFVLQIGFHSSLSAALLTPNYSFAKRKNKLPSGWSNHAYYCEKETPVLDEAVYWGED